MNLCGRRRTTIAIVIALAASIPALRSVMLGAAASSLSGLDLLSKTYEQVLDADFAAAQRTLDSCVGAPPEACQVLEATALWWQIQLDPESRALDEVFLATADEAIAVTEQWTRREPDRAEAWFYAGGAYAARVQWRVLRSERLAAARDGKRIKEALERAIALDPALDDAFFGAGMYQYYAAVAPAAAKILRWLFLLPGGDRQRGLEQMERARTQGVLLRGEADYQLALVYLWYEHQPQQALDLLLALRSAYPRNPLFHKTIAEVQDVYFHDPVASLEAYRGLLTAAEQGRMNASEIAIFEARLGMATEFDALFESDRAIEQLQAMADRKAVVPYSWRARVMLALGEARDRLGYRDEAVAAYESAMAHAPADDPFDVRGRARQHMRRRPDAVTAQAYRLSVEGWRYAENRALVRAEDALSRSLQLRPADAMTRYRYGRLLTLKREERRALAEFERVIAARASAPPMVVASTYLEVGRLLERSGERPRAIQMYIQAATVFGGTSDTRAAATRALDRLRSSPSPVRSFLP
jgi:tetratricopeptide (TPR) repeat protein